MSWFEKLLPSKIRTSGISDKKNVPEGLWAKCSACDAIIYRAELERNQEVCTKCDFHMRMPARRRLKQFFDEESQTEIAENIESEDILKFRDDKKYRDRLNQAQKQTGEKDALIVMQGNVKGVAMVVAAFEFKFMGGSMGSVVGEKFVRAVDTSIENNIPLVCFTASGGARDRKSVV
jgi:acetyl-CoA carboxylase carboxyl transferase subunit beta